MLRVSSLSHEELGAVGQWDLIPSSVAGKGFAEVPVFVTTSK